MHNLHETRPSNTKQSSNRPVTCSLYRNILHCILYVDQCDVLICAVHRLWIIPLYLTVWSHCQPDELNSTATGRLYTMIKMFKEIKSNVRYQWSGFILVPDVSERTQSRIFFSFHQSISFQQSRKPVCAERRGPAGHHFTVKNVQCCSEGH